jgi:uncharacterized protein
MPWANGAGVTREVVAEPADEWTWRLSVADVTTDGPFSMLPGVQRSIALLEGDGFVLHFGDGRRHVITTPHQPLPFSGGDEVMCTLVGSAVSDLNLMERSGQRTLELSFMTLEAGERVEVRLARAAIVVAGEVDVAACHAAERGAADQIVRLATLDAVIVENDSTIAVRSTTGQGAVVAAVVAVAG